MSNFLPEIKHRLKMEEYYMYMAGKTFRKRSLTKKLIRKRSLTYWEHNHVTCKDKILLQNVTTLIPSGKLFNSNVHWQNNW